MPVNSTTIREMNTIIENVSPPEPQLPPTIQIIPPEGVITRQNTLHPCHRENFCPPALSGTNRALLSTPSSVVTCCSWCFGGQVSLSNTWHKPVCLCCRQYTRRRLPNENLFILSTIQILCGVAAIILASVAVSSQLFLYQLGTGLWAGALMLATGLLGVITSKRKRICTLISLLVLCVLCILVAVLLGTHSVLGLLVDGGIWSPHYLYMSIRGESPSSGGQFRLYYHQTLDGRTYRLVDSSAEIVGGSGSGGGGGGSHLATGVHVVVMHTLLLIVTFLELCVAFTTAATLCRQICCGRVHYVSNRTLIIEDTLPRRGIDTRHHQQQELAELGELSSHVVPGLLRFPSGNVSTSRSGRSNSSRSSQRASSSFRASRHGGLTYALPSSREEMLSLLFPDTPPTYDESNVHLLWERLMAAMQQSPAPLAPQVTIVEERPMDVVPPPEYSTLDRTGQLPVATAETHQQQQPEG